MGTHNPILHDPDFWTNLRVLERLQKKKLCLASNLDNCEGPIIEAHTIPRSQLRNIATNGKVYEILSTVADVIRNGGEYTYRERGIGQFSILNCFCEKHDRQIFAPVEIEPLVFDTRQLSILHYRAVGSELYKKAVAVDAGDHLLKRMIKKNKSPSDVIDDVTASHTGQMIGMAQIGETLKCCEQAVFTSSYDDTSGLVIKFKHNPTIMTVGGFIPEYDYNGVQVARVDVFQPASPQMGLSILATPDGAAVVYSWLRKEKLCRAFAETLIAQQPDRFTTLIVQTAFEQLENTCMNIEWWDALVPAEQKALLRRAQSGTPSRERLASCLQFDGVCHAQWDYRDHVFIN